MLRELQVTVGKPANAMYKSGEAAIVTGMAVVKNETKKTFEFAEEETAADIFFVDKEKSVDSIRAAVTEISDYDEEAVSVAEGQFAKLVAYFPGEKIAVDQVVDGLVVGERVSAGTDGKLMRATVPSRYIFKGEMVDAGHKLAVIEVSDTAASN